MKIVANWGRKKPGMSLQINNEIDFLFHSEVAYDLHNYVEEYKLDRKLLFGQSGSSKRSNGEK